MTEETKEYKVRCPVEGCGRKVTKRGLNAHIRMAHQAGSTEEPEINKIEAVPCPTDTESTPEPSLEQPSHITHPPQPSEQKSEIEQMKDIFGDLMRQRDEQFLAQLPGLIDQRIQGMVEQARAQMQGSPGLVEQPNPGPPAVVEGQPAAGDKLGQIMGLAQMAQQLGLIPNLQQSQSPTDIFVAQLEGLSKVIGAIDTIRGGGGSGMSPNAALGWMKWGYEQGKTGAPSPEYPAVTQHPPPSPEMGKEGHP